MEFIIEQHIRKFGETRHKGQYADATIRNYISGIRSLHKLVNGPNSLFDDLDWARDHQKVLDAISHKQNPQTKRNLINGLIVSLQTIGYDNNVIKPYEDLRDQFNAQYVSAGHLTQNQKDIMKNVSKEDILKFLSKESLDTTLTQDITRLSCFVILSIHTDYPFRNELGTMRFVRRAIYDKMTDEQKKMNNWVILDNGFHKMTFAQTKYKTDKIYGIREIDVSEKHSKFILKLCQVRGIKLKGIHNIPVFTTTNGDSFTKNKLSKFLSEYTTKGLGYPISTTILAKIFGTNCKDPMNPTLEELTQMKVEADIRGHSLKTKFVIYGNYKDDEPQSP
tara:strand:+ start:118 stop:1122 length:1005 start_codon:yes stop_codon:yes gene_type:complete